MGFVTVGKKRTLLVKYHPSLPPYDYHRTRTVPPGI